MWSWFRNQNPILECEFSFCLKTHAFTCVKLHEALKPIMSFIRWLPPLEERDISIAAALPSRSYRQSTTSGTRSQRGLQHTCSRSRSACSTTRSTCSTSRSTRSQRVPTTTAFWGTTALFSLQPSSIVLVVILPARMYYIKGTSTLKTLPKAQRTRGLSSTYQSKFFGSYHKFKHKSWSNIFRISTLHQLQNLNRTSPFRQNFN